MSLRKILTPVTGKQDVMDVLLKSLKVDSDLPSTAQAQAAEISGHIDELVRRLRPELLQDLFQAIEKGALSQALTAGVVPEIVGLLESGLQDLVREEGRFAAINQRVEEAYRRVVEVQMPLAEFLSQKTSPQDTELAQRITELKTFRDTLASQKSSLERLGEKISATKQALVRLKEQAARLGQTPQQAQTTPSPPQGSPLPQQS